MATFGAFTRVRLSLALSGARFDVTGSGALDDIGSKGISEEAPSAMSCDCVRLLQVELEQRITF